MDISLRFKDQLNDSKLWAAFEHYDQNARDQMTASTHIIDIGMKTADEVTEAAFNIVRDMFRAASPEPEKSSSSTAAPAAVAATTVGAPKKDLASGGCSERGPATA